MGSSRICVIGCGPAGLATLKIIKDSAQFQDGTWTIDAYEARDKVGGVWVPAPPTDDPPLTPLYDSLTTNLPHPVMAFTSYSFPPSTNVFPKAHVVEEYLQSYADHFDLTPYIHLRTSVSSVKRNSSKGWKVSLSTGETTGFDYIVVSNGHYRVPHYPDTPGLQSWISAKRASHSAWYRHPEKSYGTVLVVGGGPSGTDITTEVRRRSQTVIQSTTEPVPEGEGNLKRRGRIARFLPNGEVEFEDGSKEGGIEHCFLATGYDMSFPFFDENLLKVGVPPSFTDRPIPKDVVWNTRGSVWPLARHVFPLIEENGPTVAFVGLPIKVAPFPLMEAQAKAIVKVFAEPRSFDRVKEEEDIVRRGEQLRVSKGSSEGVADAWHVFRDNEQFEYRDEQFRFADGGSVVVPEWEKEMYEKKDVLKRAWFDLVRKGEADSYVEGVGEKGPEEWVDLLRKLLET